MKREAGCSREIAFASGGFIREFERGIANDVLPYPIPRRKSEAATIRHDCWMCRSYVVEGSTVVR